jgi:hypothetical protein
MPALGRAGNENRHYGTAAKSAQLRHPGRSTGQLTEKINENPPVAFHILIKKKSENLIAPQSAYTTAE